MSCTDADSDEWYHIVDEDDLESAKPAELAEHLRIVRAYEDELRAQIGEMWRLRHTDLDRSALNTLSSAFLVCKDEAESRWGRVATWELTERCEWLLDVLAETEIDITDEEADAIVTVGEAIWDLPSAGEDDWYLSDVEADVWAQDLTALVEAGLIDDVADLDRAGYPTEWTSTPRLDDVRAQLSAVVMAHE
jgi:hypothetical protein